MSITLAAAAGATSLAVSGYGLAAAVGARGVGFAGPPMRVGAPPDITIVTLR